MDTSVILDLLRRAHAPTLALSVLLLTASLLVKALRWHALLPRPCTMRRLEAVRILYVSILINNVLPLRMGDGLRVVSAPVRRVATRPQAVAVLLTEGLLDATTLGGCALVALPFATGAGVALGPLLREPPPVPAASMLLCVSGFGLVGGAWAAHRIGRRRGGRVRWLAALVAETASVLRMDRRRVAAVGALTLIAWSGTFALHYILLLALDLEGSLALAVLITVSTNLSMLVPGTPANVGLGHAAAAAPLLAWGQPADVAVTYAVLVHAVNTIPPVLIGAACIAARWLRVLVRASDA